MNDFADPPFACPPDTILDVPVPPSVNRTRRVNWAAKPIVDAWKREADGMVVASGQFRAARKMAGRYELTVILDEKKCRADPDNILKVAVDYLRRLKVIENDSPKFARRITVEWGIAPSGCRLVLKDAA